MSSHDARVADPCWTAEAYRQLSDFGTLIEQSCRTFCNDRYLEPAEPDIDAVSFARVGTFVRGFEVFLERHGVRPGDCCAVISNSNTVLVLQFLAVMATDRVFVPINPNSSADDITFIVGDCSARVVIYEAKLEEKVSFLKETCELIPIVGSGPFIDLVLKLADERPVKSSAPRPDSVAEIVYTTGTTGRPKGVKLTHRNLIADLFGIGQAFGFSRGDRFLTVTPLFHNSGQIMTTLIPLYCGGVTTTVRPDMGFINFWHYVDRFQPAWTLVMPSHIALMLDRKESPTTASLRGILCGGAKLEPRTQLEFEHRFSVPIYANYGLTESASIATCVRPEDTDRASGGVGRPLDINEVRVFKGTRGADPGEVGEIRIKGDNVFTGYLNLPELYAEKVQRGWLHTGDLGHVDQGGSIHIVDRIDNMTLVGGENVYPSEVEQFVPDLAGVSEGFLLSLPDRIMGRQLVLVYRLSPGSLANIKEWKAVLFAKLVSFKVPREFIDIRDLGLEDFPRSQNGKLLRKRLQRILEAARCPEEAKAAAVRDEQSSRAFRKAAAIVAGVMEIEPEAVHEDLHMDHVPSWDSMNHLKLMIALEQAFGVVFSPAQIAEMIDMRAIMAVLGTRDHPASG